MVCQFSALETLVPPNFMTTQGESAISVEAPSDRAVGKIRFCQSFVHLPAQPFL